MDNYDAWALFHVEVLQAMLDAPFKTHAVSQLNPGSNLQTGHVIALAGLLRKNAKHLVVPHKGQAFHTLLFHSACDRTAMVCR